MTMARGRPPAGAVLHVDPTLKSVVDRPGGWRLDNRLTPADPPFS